MAPNPIGIAERRAHSIDISEDPLDLRAELPCPGLAAKARPPLAQRRVVRKAAGRAQGPRVEL